MLKLIKPISNGLLLTDDFNQYWFVTSDIGENYCNVPECVPLHRVIYDTEFYQSELEKFKPLHVEEKVTPFADAVATA